MRIKERLISEMFKKREKIEILDIAEAKRRTEISYISILFAFIVIFIHACSEPLGVSGYSLNSVPFYLTLSLFRLSSFAVQGFIFLSGVKLFINLKEPYDCVGTWLRQYKRVVLPYVLWVCLYFSFFVTINWEVFSLKALVKYILVGNLSAHFYFVVVIVQFYLLAPLFVKLVKKLRPAILLPAAFVLMIYLWQYLPDTLSKVLTTADSELVAYPIRVYLKYIDRVFTSYLFYFILGLVVGRFYESFMVGLRKSGIVVVFTYCVFSAVDVFGYVLVRNLAPEGKLYPMFNRFNEIFHVLYCISAILFCYYVIDAITRRLPKGMPRPVRLMDKATYLVYLVHPLVLQLFKSLMDRKLIVGVTGRFAIAFFGTVLVSFISVMIWQFVVKKYNERLNKTINK